MTERSDLRSRLLVAAVECAGTFGIDGFSMETVAERAGTSRASVYRHFPNGRDQLVHEAVAFEVGRFVEGLGLDRDGALPFPERLELLLGRAGDAIAAHEILQRLLIEEPEALLELLDSVQPLLLEVLTQAVRTELEHHELRSGVTLDQAADYVARIVLSVVSSPGRWDLSRTDDRRRIVADELLGAVIAD